MTDVCAPPPLDTSAATLAALTATLRAHATSYELERQWPTRSLQAYTDLGGWRWGLPESHGGWSRRPSERLNGYVALARGDMSAALFITQHEGAVDLISMCDNQQLRDAWLPRFASGEALTTIGYSQLTTSRQGGAPAMRAEAVEGGYRLDGVMPWVTGAPYVDNVACGAALDDGTQLLGLVPMDGAGVEIVPAPILAALNSTHTCEVRCDGTFLPHADVIAGPVENVLTHRSALRLLLVSATGVGLALGISDEVRALGERPGYAVEADVLAQIDRTNSSLRVRLEQLAARETLDQTPIDALRIDIDDWLIRLAGVLMVCAKGTGYREDANAQRLAREAPFFCVWSASGAVRAGTIERLLRPRAEARGE